MLAVQEPVPGLLGADAGVPLGGERASDHPAGRARPTAAARKRSTLELLPVAPGDSPDCSF
jgi:hypothetical protein